MIKKMCVYNPGTETSTLIMNYRQSQLTVLTFLGIVQKKKLVLSLLLELDKDIDFSLEWWMDGTSYKIFENCDGNYYQL